MQQDPFLICVSILTVCVLFSSLLAVPAFSSDGAGYDALDYDAFFGVGASGADGASGTGEGADGTVPAGSGDPSYGEGGDSGDPLADEWFLTGGALLGNANENPDGGTNVNPDNDNPNSGTNSNPDDQNPDGGTPDGFVPENTDINVPDNNVNNTTDDGFVPAQSARRALSARRRTRSAGGFIGSAAVDGVIVAAGILLLDVNRHEKHAEKASGEVMSLLRPMLALEEETEQTPVDDAESVLSDGTDEPEKGPEQERETQAQEPPAETAEPVRAPETEPQAPPPPETEPPETEPPQTEPETEPAQEDDGEPTVAINGKDYLGYLTFPGYGKELPVVAEWDFEKLNDAPVRYSGTAAGDDLVISGHNFRVHFGFLGNMKKGDRVTFTDARGNVISYRVGLVEVLRATDIEKMTAGEWDLTLFTCDYDGQARIAVRCDRDNAAG